MCDFDSSCALMFSSLNLLAPTTNGPFLSWSVFAKVLHALQNIDSISSSNTSHSRSRPWSSFFHADWNFLWRVCLSNCLNRSADWFSPDLAFFLGDSTLDRQRHILTEVKAENVSRNLATTEIRTLDNKLYWLVDNVGVHFRSWNCRRQICGADVHLSTESQYSTE